MFPALLQNQALQTPQQLPKIFSSKEDASLAISIVLNGLDTAPPQVKAERVNVIQLFCAPQSLAWQECEDVIRGFAAAVGVSL